MVMRLSAASIRLLKRRTMRPGDSARAASCAGDDSSTMAWARARGGAAKPDARARARAARKAARITGSAPVVEHQVVGVFVLDLLPPFHADHGEVDVIAALHQDLVRVPVVGVDRRQHPRALLFVLE